MIEEKDEVRAFGDEVSLGQVAGGGFVLYLNEGCCGGCDGIVREDGKKLADSCEQEEEESVYDVLVHWVRGFEAFGHGD